LAWDCKVLFEPSIDLADLLQSPGRRKITIPGFIQRLENTKALPSLAFYQLETNKADINSVWPTHCSDLRTEREGCAFHPLRTFATSSRAAE
jgi:hypothetical protein